jgi:hypothetical protein
VVPAIDAISGREYAESFPQGLKEYNKARLGQVRGLLDRLIAATTKHQTALGPELLAEFTSIKTSIFTARRSFGEGRVASPTPMKRP